MKTAFVSFKSPAKVNLGLRVMDRRPDGYHHIKTLMVKVSLYDHVAVRLSDKGITVACPDPRVPQDDKNLVYRAIEIFQKEYGGVEGLGVHIIKDIPIAAGLGGGSSNAAQVFKGLRLMIKPEVKMDDIRTLAVKIGADVPFFLFPGAAWGEGIGDDLDIYQGPLPGAFVLIQPGCQVSSRWAYGQWDELNSAGKVPAANEYPMMLPKSRFQDIYWKQVLSNDLEPAVTEQYPEVAEARRALEDAGAPAVGMSGSGPVVFGVFPDEESAGRVAGKVEENKDWSVTIVKPVEE